LLLEGGDMIPMSALREIGPIVASRNSTRFTWTACQAAPRGAVMQSHHLQASMPRSLHCGVVETGSRRNAMLAVARIAVA
jgi:hypothetical protein